ncbi:MAG: hypothetical protein ACREDM_14195 [Methylocella sp.]
MSSLRIVLLATVCLTLAACDRYMEERYLVRRDAVTSSAGDSVASNSAVQIPTPWPRGSNNPNIAFDGEKMGNAVKSYREDMEFLRDQEVDKANIGRGSPTGAGAAAGPPPGLGYGAGAAAGPPPGLGYGAGAAPGP